MQGSPFVILVEGVEPKKAPAVGSPCDVNLVLPDISLPRDLPYLKATLTRPTGKKEPLELGIGPDNSLSMNFTPTETGKHVIDITKNGKPIKQSPITILVEEEEKPKVLFLLDNLIALFILLKAMYPYKYSHVNTQSKYADMMPQTAHCDW